MKAIQAGLNAAREANPNLMEYAGREVWRGHAQSVVADAVPKWAWTNEAAPAAGTHAPPREGTDRHPARDGDVLVCAAVQRLLRKPRRPRRQHRLFRSHQRGDVPPGGQARLHRPLLPVEAGAGARAQPAFRQAPPQAARLHLLPDVRRAALAAGQPARHQRLSDHVADARSGQGRVHEGSRPVPDNGVAYVHPLLDVSSPQMLARQMFGA